MAKKSHIDRVVETLEGYMAEKQREIEWIRADIDRIRKTVAGKPARKPKAPNPDALRVTA